MLRLQDYSTMPELIKRKLFSRDVARGDGHTEMGGQLYKDRFVCFDCVLMNEACDTPANNGCLEILLWCTSYDRCLLMVSYGYDVYTKFFEKSALYLAKILSLINAPFCSTVQDLKW